MSGSSQPPVLRPAGRGALLVYIAAWCAIGAAVAFGVIALLHRAQDPVVLPPVRQTDLVVAADRAGCRLRRGPSRRGDEVPNEGRDAPPAKAGIYAEEQAGPQVIGALRRGLVVINYRPGLPESDVERLATLQRAVPAGTIVAPNGRLQEPIAVTAWRRSLTCRTLDDRAVDAVRLFRGRYVGSGPNTPR